MTQMMLEPFDLRGKLILADKEYDSDKFVRWIEERGEIPVIPSRITAKHPRNTDWHIYKERHLVENLFLKLKHHRRFATRYETIFTLLSPLPVSFFGCLDGFKTDSSVWVSSYKKAGQFCFLTCTLTSIRFLYESPAQYLKECHPIQLEKTGSGNKGHFPDSDRQTTLR